MNNYNILAQIAGQTPVPLPPPTTSWEDPVTLATLVIAFFTVVSAIISIFLWIATRRQAQITREIFESAHRPYVGITKLSGGMSIEEQVHGWLVIWLKNSGAVPAYRLLTTWHLSIGEVELSIPRPATKGTVLLPDEDTRVMLDYHFSRELFSELEKGESLKILVTIEYKGVTDQKYHYTQHAVYSGSNDLGYVMTEADST